MKQVFALLSITALSLLFAGRVYAHPGPRPHLDHEQQRAAHINRDAAEHKAEPLAAEGRSHAAPEAKNQSMNPAANGEGGKRPARLTPEERQALRQQIKEDSRSLYEGKR